MLTRVLFLPLVLLTGSMPLVGAEVSAAVAAPMPPAALLASAQIPGQVSEIYLSAVPDLTDATTGVELAEAPLEAAYVRAGEEQTLVYLSPTTVPEEFLGAGGVVDFRLTASGDQGAWTTNFSARGVKLGDAWMWLDPVRADLAPSTLQVRRDGLMAARAVSAARELEDDGPVVGSFARVATSMPVCTYSPTNETHYPWVTFGTTYPAGTDTAMVSFSSESGARYGVAWAAHGQGWAAASGATTISSSSSWGWNSVPSPHNKAYQLSVEYRRFELWCSDYVDPQGTRTHIGSELRPIAETGGVRGVNGLDRPSWNTYCKDVPVGDWWKGWAEGASYSYGAGVKLAGVIGIDLYSERQYSSNYRVMYRVSARNKKMCGSDTWPARSKKQMERFR